MGPALATAFRTVDEKVLRAARQDGKDYGSTATVALCFAAHRSLFVAHVGDSRSVLSRCPPSTPLNRVPQWDAATAPGGGLHLVVQRDQYHYLHRQGCLRDVVWGCQATCARYCAWGGQIGHR